MHLYICPFVHLCIGHFIFVFAFGICSLTTFRSIFFFLVCVLCAKRNPSPEAEEEVREVSRRFIMLADQCEEKFHVLKVLDWIGL